MDDNEYRERVVNALERIAAVMGPRVLTAEEAEARAANANLAEIEAEVEAAGLAVAIYERREKQEKEQKLGVGLDEAEKRAAARERLVAAEAALKEATR